MQDRKKCRLNEMKNLFINDEKYISFGKWIALVRLAREKVNMSNFLLAMHALNV